MEMSPKCLCVALPMLGACRKANKAARRPFSARVGRGSVEGYGRDVSPPVFIGNEYVAGWVTVGSAGGPAAPSAYMSSDWKNLHVRVGSVTRVRSSGRIAIAV